MQSYDFYNVVKHVLCTSYLEGESPFRVEASDYQDPMMVNVHQFYPIIDQSFRRGFSGRLGEEKTVCKFILNSYKCLKKCVCIHADADEIAH